MIELAKQQVKETVMNALGRLVAEGKIEAVPLPAFNVERPSDVSHGDFSCNAAMASAKALRNNPRAIGQMIADAAVLDGTVFEKIDADDVPYHATASSRDCPLSIPYCWCES